MEITEKLIERIIHIAVEAGVAILDVYHKGFSIDYKSDNSPITDADRGAHDIITNGLSRLPDVLPILSEEGEMPQKTERQSWSEYWLIDPLDGTKEFVKKNGEFTVNIALIRRADAGASVWLPVFGIVYAPLTDEAYLGWVYDDDGDGIMPGQAYCVHELTQSEEYWRENARELIPIERIEYANMPVRVMASRSHLNKETEEFIQKIETDLGDIETVSHGSSLKMCKIASGYAHVYPRFAPTMEWDTAAAHGVCRATGVSVIDVTTCTPLSYNKEDVKNPGILVTGIQSFKDFLCDHIS